MKLFNFLFYGLIGSLLLFGVVMEGYGQAGGNPGGGGPGGGVVDCADCRPIGNQRGNFIIQEAYLSDSFGNRISAAECDLASPVSIFWITLNYTSRDELYNVKLLFDLLILNKIGNTEVGRENVTYFVENPVLATEGNEQKSLTIRIELENNTFDCSDQRLELANTQAFWTPNSDLNISGQCGGYPPGLCSRAPLVITPVGINGFLYDFDYLIDCLTEGDSPNSTVTFFVSSLAGGLPEYDIEWTFTVNDEEVEENYDGLFFVEKDFEGGEIVKVDLKIIPSNIAQIDPGQISEPESITFTIPMPINPIIYNEDTDKKDNDLTAAITPNGFINVGLDSDEGFSFFWISEDGSFFNDQDLSIDGLSEGVYFLNVTELDINGQPTGACRVYRFEIFDITPQPVIYSDINIEFIEKIRTNKFSWSTTKEWEASHYEVERAVNGTQFEKIGEVKAAGWSDQIQEYVFEDKALPLIGGNLLYRLKQVDFNGDYHYSEVLSVRVPGVEFTSGVWRAYPNPTDGNALRISLLDASQYQNEPLTFRLIHPTAQTPAMTLASEMELNEVLAQMTARIPKGVFVVEIQWGQKVEHIKVLKQ